MKLKKIEIYIFGITMLLMHLLINQITSAPIALQAIISIQLFFFSSLIIVKSYMTRKMKKDSARLWTYYLASFFLKFFIFLFFIYQFKNYFEITKQQALLHIFLWYFVYLFYEMRMLVKEIGERFKKNT